MPPEGPGERPEKITLESLDVGMEFTDHSEIREVLEVCAGSNKELTLVSPDFKNGVIGLVEAVSDNICTLQVSKFGDAIPQYWAGSNYPFQLEKISKVVVSVPLQPNGNLFVGCRQ